MTTTPEQAVALAAKYRIDKHSLFFGNSEFADDKFVEMLADHEQQVIAGLVARAEATSVQIEAWVDAAVQDGCTTRGMLGSYVATLAYQAGFAAAQIKSRPTEGDQHEQQIRPQMDAVGGRQPVEGASTVFTGGGADLVSSITALLELDAAGALVPHGVGGHARNLLTAAAEAIAALQAKLEALQVDLKHTGKCCVEWAEAFGNANTRTEALQAEVARLQREVVNRNQRALDGDKAVAVRDAALAREEAALARLAVLEKQEPLCWMRDGEVSRWNGLSAIGGYTGPLFAAAGASPVEPSQADGFVLMPVEPTHKIISAMACSKARDDEGEFPAMLDLIDYGGENKTHTVLKAAYRAAINAKGDVS